MTRVPTSSNGRAAGKRIVGVDRRRDGVRLVVVETGDRMRVLDARKIVADDDRALIGAIKDAKADVVVHVLPSAESVTRVVEAALSGDEGQDAAAIALLVDTQLPDTIPAHRRAAGVIAAPNRAMASVLLTGWPTTESHAPLPGKIDQRWVAESAALSQLAGAAEGVSWSIDRARGALCIVAHGHQRTLVRSLRTHDADDHDWAQSVRDALEETADAAGTSVELDDTPPTLSLADGAADAVRSRLSGMARSTDWFDDYGLALGAVLCVVAPATTSSLSAIRHDAPKRRDPAHRRASRWLATPSHAYGAIGASLLIALGSPWAFAAARLAILDAKTSTLAEREAALEDVHRRAALYRQLEQTRWPMTKLLADVAGATPVGVTADSVRISARHGLRFDGFAESDEIIIGFQQNLADTGIFRNVRIDSSDSTSPGNVGFALSAEIVAPLKAVAPAEDFGAATLSERLYGEGASNTTFDPSVSHSPTRTSRRAPTARDSVEGDRGERPDFVSARPTVSDEPVPEPLTDDQIDAMTLQATMKEWVARRTYPQKHPEIDAQTKTRLEDEVRKLLAHRTKLQGGG